MIKIKENDNNINDKKFRLVKIQNEYSIINELIGEYVFMLKDSLTYNGYKSVDDVMNDIKKWNPKVYEQGIIIDDSCYQSLDTDYIIGIYVSNNSPMFLVRECIDESEAIDKLSEYIMYNWDWDYDDFCDNITFIEKL